MEPKPKDIYGLDKTWEMGMTNTLAISTLGLDAWLRRAESIGYLGI